MALRDRREHIYGAPGLGARDAAKVAAGNATMKVSANLIAVMRQRKIPVALENGDLSMLWSAPEIVEHLAEAEIFKVDYCMMGRPYRKRTRLAVWCLQNPALPSHVRRTCKRKYCCSSKGGICDRTGEKHLILRGWVRSGLFKRTQGAQYPSKFANLVAQLCCEWGRK